jgi:hypothetical protein
MKEFPASPQPKLADRISKDIKRVEVHVVLRERLRQSVGPVARRIFARHVSPQSLKALRGFKNCANDPILTTSHSTPSVLRPRLVQEVLGSTGWHLVSDV